MEPVVILFYNLWGDRGNTRGKINQNIVDHERFPSRANFDSTIFEGSRAYPLLHLSPPEIKPEGWEIARPSLSDSGVNLPGQ
jgi:hypothetical protein